MLLTSIPSISIFCGGTGFYSDKCPYSCIYLSSIPDSVLSAPLPYGRDHTLVAPHYQSMENIQPVVAIQMSDFRKQAELGRDSEVQNSSWILLSWIFTLLIERAQSLCPTGTRCILIVKHTLTSLLISYFIWKEYFILFSYDFCSSEVLPHKLLRIFPYKT